MPSGLLSVWNVSSAHPPVHAEVVDRVEKEYIDFSSIVKVLHVVAAIISPLGKVQHSEKQIEAKHQLQHAFIAKHFFSQTSHKHVYSTWVRALIDNQIFIGGP